MTSEIFSLMCMIYFAIEDIRKRSIPIAACALYIAAGIVRAAAEEFSVWALLPGLVIGVISFATRGKIGMADAIIISGMGLFASVSVVMVSVFFGLILSSVIGVFYLLKRRYGTELPFIPFLLIGYAAVLFIAR